MCHDITTFLGVASCQHHGPFPAPPRRSPAVPAFLSLPSRFASAECRLTQNSSSLTNKQQTSLCGHSSAQWQKCPTLYRR